MKIGNCFIRVCGRRPSNSSTRTDSRANNYAGGRGYVIVDEQNDEYTVNHPAFEIDPDGKVGTTDGQGYGWIMSVFHQLHCLVCYPYHHWS